MICSSATFSECGAYRYALERVWDADGSRCVFLMLNPSTATETVNDPTVSRCIAYAQRWGHGALTVLNLFALRSTDPRALYKHLAPIGPDNDRAIRLETARAARIVCAWGVHGELYDRGRDVARGLSLLGRPLSVLGLTKDGHPKHPLYLRADLQPFAWEPQAARPAALEGE